MLVPNRALMRTVARSADILGAPLPKALVAELDRITNFTAAAEAVPASGDALVARVLDALREGRQYNDDAEIVRQLLDHTLVSLNIGDAARGRADREIGTALTAHADEIMAIWSETLVPHSAALVVAADALPADLEDVRNITARGTDALRHWAAAKTALRMWNAALDGVGALRGAAHLGPTDRLTLQSDASLEQHGTVRAAAAAVGTEPDVWTLARCGITPCLPASLGEIMARAAEHQQARAEAAKRYEDQERAARKAHTTGAVTG